MTVLAITLITASTCMFVKFNILYLCLRWNQHHHYSISMHRHTSPDGFGVGAPTYFTEST